MIEPLSRLNRKRRITTRRVSKAPTYLVTSLGVGLLLSPSHSFSIRNPLIAPITSNSVGIKNTFLPSRPGSTSLPYLNYDLDFGLNDSIGLEENERNIRSRFADSTSQQKTYSDQETWEGLSNVMGSPSSGFALGYSLFVPKGVSVSFLTTDRRTPKLSPLIVTPDQTNRNLGDNTMKDSLRSFLNTYQKWVDERVLEYGGIVFRGFGGADHTKSIEEITAAGKEILRAFSNDTEGIRKEFEYYLVSNINSKGLQHTSRKKDAQPLRLTKISTETKITDWRSIHGDLPSNLQRKLDEKHLLYKRTDLVKKKIQDNRSFQKRNNEVFMNHNNGEENISDAIATATTSSSWLELYGSTNKKVFETAYNQLLEKTLYFPQESEFVCEAFRRHPQTNQKIWFELAHRFHWTSLPAQFITEFKYSKNPWALVRAVGAASNGLWKRLRRSNTTPLNSSRRYSQENDNISVAFGDGKPISWWEMHQIRRAINKNTEHFSWKPGDILVVDGLSLGVQ